MPSKKPVIQLHTDQWIIDEMKKIARLENRSLANCVECLLKARIEQQEGMEEQWMKITE